MSHNFGSPPQTLQASQKTPEVADGETQLGGVAAWQSKSSMLLENQVAGMNPGTNQELTIKIVAFLREIGLEVQAGVIDGDLILPGIKVDQGVLFYDPARLQFPGDLLHEAGHLAVKSVADRTQAGANLGGDPAEEMMAISWSYAAAMHLRVSPEVVFHPTGYRGGSQSLLDNFAAARYLAVPMLQWLGMTYDEKQAQAIGVLPYPKMKTWLLVN